MTMSGLRTNHVTGHWNIVDNEDIHSLNSCLYIHVRAVFKSKSMRRTGNTAHMEWIRVYRTVLNRNVKQRQKLGDVSLRGRSNCES